MKLPGVQGYRLLLGWASPTSAGAGVPDFLLAITAPPQLACHRNLSGCPVSICVACFVHYRSAVGAPENAFEFLDGSWVHLIIAAFGQGCLRICMLRPLGLLRWALHVTGRADETATAVGEIGGQIVRKRSVAKTTSPLLHSGFELLQPWALHVGGGGLTDEGKW